MKKFLKTSRKKKLKNKNYFSNFNKIFILSFALIIIFSSMPNFAIYIKKNFYSHKIIINSSNKNFNKLINKDNVDKKKITTLKEKIFIFTDIYNDIDFFPKKEEGNNSSRLSATTIEELFEDTKYNLKKVRETKLVNIGNSIDHLPKEIKNIESTKKKKKLFIQIVLPLIIEENTKIKLDRKKLFVILNKSNNSEREKKWLSDKFIQYGVKNKDLTTIKIRMDVIPVSLAIAQAAKETGWGTSRFAQEGNALFGQWTWSGDGIKPAAVEKNAKHKVMRFKVLKASVRAYQRNLNTHPSYKNFRLKRAGQRDNNESLDSLELVNYLDKYAETGVEYTKVIKQIIKQNSLKDFDDVKILPTNKKLKSII